MANLATTENNMVIADGSDFAIPRGFICTVDLTTLDGKLALANALNGAVSMKDKIDDTLRVVDIVTTQGARARTGEECINSYLICDDGTVYFSQSDGIARSLKVLVAIFTNAETGEFTSPVSLGVGMQVKEQTLAKGNTLKSVIPVKL